MDPAVPTDANDVHTSEDSHLHFCSELCELDFLLRVSSRGRLTQRATGMPGGTGIVSERMH